MATRTNRTSANANANASDSTDSKSAFAEFDESAVRAHVEQHPDQKAVDVVEALNLDPAVKMKVAGMIAAHSKATNGNGNGNGHANGNGNGNGKRNGGNSMTLTMDRQKFTGFIDKGIPFTCAFDGETYSVTLSADAVSELLSSAIG